MKVLLVSGDFTIWGGMDRANYELAWYLAEEVRASVSLVAYHVAEPLASHPNVIWRRVAKPLNSYALGAFLLSRTGEAEAARIEKEGGYAVVNGGNCIWHGVNWVHAVQHSWQRRLDHAPVSVRLRQWFSGRNDLRAEKRALQIAGVVVANSEQSRARIMSEVKISPDRVCTVYYGIDPAVFRPVSEEERREARTKLGCRSSALTAIFVGALGHERNKGFDVLFEAWKLLCADPAWDVDLVAAGGGADVIYWQTQAQQAGLGPRIRMLGFTKDIPELLRAADVMIQPSFYEAYGLAVHEALCCGIPALVTRTSGIAERYPATLADLLLDSPPSVSDLVKCIRRWRDDVQGYRFRLQDFSSQLRQRSWADMAREFVEVAMPALAKVSV